jgi:hypothetical protein
MGITWRTRAVRIWLAVWKFFCRNLACGHRILTERLPNLVAASARKIICVVTVLWTIGIALWGRGGPARLQLPAGAATLLWLPLEAARQRHHTRRVAAYRAVHMLHAQSTTVAIIARSLRISRPPVYTDLMAVNARLTLEWSNGVAEDRTWMDSGL